MGVESPFFNVAKVESLTRIRILAYIVIGLVSGGATTHTPTHTTGAMMMKASTYGLFHHGKTMAYGGAFDQNNPTIVAHWTLPKNTMLLLTETRSGKNTIACVYDRGPDPAITEKNGTVIDLGTATARELGFTTGHRTLKVQVLGTCAPYTPTHPKPSTGAPRLLAGDLLPYGRGLPVFLYRVHAMHTALTKAL